MMVYLNKDLIVEFLKKTDFPTPRTCSRNICYHCYWFLICEVLVF